MNDDRRLGWVVDSEGVKVWGPDGHAYTREEYLELESETAVPALDVPTIDIVPEMVRDTEIHREREIES